MFLELITLVKKTLNKRYFSISEVGLDTAEKGAMVSDFGIVLLGIGSD